MGRFITRIQHPREYYSDRDPEMRFTDPTLAKEHDATLAIQEARNTAPLGRLAGRLGAEDVGKIGDGRNNIGAMIAPGTPIGQTEAGQAAYKAEQERLAQEGQLEQREKMKAGLQQFADQFGAGATKAMMNMLANVGMETEGLGFAVKELEEKQKQERALALEGKKHEQRLVEGEARQEDVLELQDVKQHDELEKLMKKFGYDKQLEEIKVSGREKLAQMPKPIERRSTTTAAKMTSDLGFGLEKLKVLRDKVSSGDANVFNTSRILGEFTDPELRDAVLQLEELHGRQQSGAAISKSEWKNFSKQILNKKNLVTEEGKKAALKNIDDFIGRYFAKGHAVTQDDNWYSNYKDTAKMGVEGISGVGTSGEEPEQQTEKVNTLRKKYGY